MRIYLSDTTDFENNGLGFLTDVIEAKVTEEINSTYSLNFEYPVNGANSQYIVEENIVKCNSSTKENQLFRIKKIVKNFETLQVYCLHIFYDLKDNFIEDCAPTDKDAESFGEWVLSKSNFETPFIVESTISKIRSARYVRRNPAECFIGDIDNSIVNLFGAELDRDNFKIRIVDKIGENNNVKLQIGKNITGIEITIDITELYTRLCPVGYDGLMLPEKYVDSELIDNYLTPKIGKIEFSEIRYDPNDENAYQNINEAYTALREACKSFYATGGDKPNINIKIDWIELSKIEEYKNKYANLERVQLGDTITAEILGLNYETRVFKTIFNSLTDTIESYELGTARESVSSTINNFNKKVEDINPTDILTRAKEEATSMLTSAMGGYVYKTQNEFFIMDTDNPLTAQKVWRWNLNGLGYSNSGIDGPYGQAITQDGSIVADFIKTGKLDANLIEGFNELVLKIDNIESPSGASIIMKINEDESGITLNATKIKLEGYTTINKGFGVDLEGNAFMNGATINGGSIEMIDDGIEDEHSIKLYKGSDIEEISRPIQVGDDLGGKILKLSFPNGFTGTTTGPSISFENLIVCENGSIRYVYGYQYSEAINIWYAFNGENKDLFLDYYNSDDDSHNIQTNLQSIMIPKGFGKVTSINSEIKDMTNNKSLIEYFTYNYENIKYSTEFNSNGVSIRKDNVQASYQGDGMEITDARGNRYFNTNGINWQTPYGVDFAQFLVDKETIIFNSGSQFLVDFTGSDATNHNLELTIDNETALKVTKNGIQTPNVETWQSDKRLKENIRDCNYDALDIVKKIRHRQFKFKDKEETIAIGYIADELEELDENLIFEVGKEKIKHPKQSYIIPILSKAIQEQQMQIEELRKEISELKKVIK